MTNRWTGGAAAAAGVATVICAVPAPATSAAEMAAVSCVALRNVVVRRTIPAHRGARSRATAVHQEGERSGPDRGARRDQSMSPGAGLVTVKAAPRTCRARPGVTTVTCGVRPLPRPRPDGGRQLRGLHEGSSCGRPRSIARSTPHEAGAGQREREGRVAGDVPVGDSGGERRDGLLTLNVCRRSPAARRRRRHRDRRRRRGRRVGAGIAAVSCVALTKVVSCRAAPFQRTLEAPRSCCHSR